MGLFDLFKGKSNSHNKTAEPRIKVSFGHDAVNYLKLETPNGYDKLNTYVSQWYTNKYGQEALMNRISSITQQRGIDLFEAVGEHLADSIDTIITDKSIIKDIKQSDEELYGNLKDWASELIRKTKTAMESLGNKADNQANLMLKRKINLIAESFDIDRI